MGHQDRHPGLLASMVHHPWDMAIRLYPSLVGPESPPTTSTVPMSTTQTHILPSPAAARRPWHPGTTSQQGRSTQGLRPHTPGTLPVLPKTGQKTSLGISLDMHHAQEGGHGARSWTARLASHRRCYVVTTICKSQASLRQAAGIAGNPMWHLGQNTDRIPRSVLQRAVCWGVRESSGGGGFGGAWIMVSMGNKVWVKRKSLHRHGAGPCGAPGHKDFLCPPILWWQEMSFTQRLWPSLSSNL